MNLKSKKFFTSAGLLFLVLLSVGLFLYLWDRGKSETSYPELKLINEGDLDFAGLYKLFTETAEAKGSLYAFEVLRRAEFPPNTDTHLLGHAVGDVLFKEKGIEGMTLCTEEFRNACSHSIVVGYLFEKGEEGLADIFGACKKAPGGSGAYTMCYHGLGHGILAYTDYDLEKAVALCEVNGTAEYGGREGVECIGGIIMEIISGGAHDRVAWEAARKKYLGGPDPLYPCPAPFMPKAAKPQCLVYLTPYLWEQAGGDINNPEVEDFKAAFRFCDVLPLGSVERDACYGGFGKEFVGLVKLRDIRNIENFSLEDSKTVYDWCLLAEVKDGIESCIRQAVNSLYWGGENEVRSAITFCENIPDAGYQDECFRHLSGAVSYYSGNNKKKVEEFCQQLPEAFMEYCHE